jgi:hypothetical protein
VGDHSFCDELTDDFGGAIEIDRRLLLVLSFGGNLAARRFGTFATLSARSGRSTTDKVLRLFLSVSELTPFVEFLDQWEIGSVLVPGSRGAVVRMGQA